MTLMRHFILILFLIATRFPVFAGPTGPVIEDMAYLDQSLVLKVKNHGKKAYRGPLEIAVRFRSKRYQLHYPQVVLAQGESKFLSVHVGHFLSRKQGPFMARVSVKSPGNAWHDLKKGLYLRHKSKWGFWPGRSISNIDQSSEKMITK